MRKQVLVIILAAMVCTLMACSGTMKGIDRYSGQRVQLAYTDEKFGSAGLRIKMPDGEIFTGKMIETPASAGLGSRSGKDYSAVNEFRGNSEAFLVGDRGNNMRCKFRLSDSMLGFRGGGFGLCETSDGRVVDVFTR